jgi:hypothetical protein
MAATIVVLSRNARTKYEQWPTIFSENQKTPEAHSFVRRKILPLEASMKIGSVAFAKDVACTLLKFFDYLAQAVLARRRFAANVLI